MGSPALLISKNLTHVTRPELYLHMLTVRAEDVGHLRATSSALSNLLTMPTCPVTLS